MSKHRKHKRKTRKGPGEQSPHQPADSRATGGGSQVADVGAKAKHLAPAQLVGLAALAALIAVFLVLRAWALLPHPADEGIYFYGATRMGEGLWPYRDFFHAHPPLHLLPTALLIKVLGFSQTVAKLPTFLWAAFHGVAVYAVVTRTSAGDPPGPRILAGLLGAAAILFSESFLKAASTDTGMMQATGLVALGAFLLVQDRPLLAGLAAGAAPMTLLQAAPAAAMVPLAALLVSRKSGVRCILGAAVLPVLLHLFFLAVAGRAFIAQMYLFHLGKVASEGEGARQLGFLLFDNFTLFAGATAGAAALLMQKRRDQVLALLAAGSIILTFVAMATRPRVFPFYFQPGLFPAALLCGWGASRIFATAWRWWVTSRAGKATPPDARTYLPLALAAALFTVLRAPIAGAISPTRAEQIKTYRQSYTWVDGPGIGFLNGAVRKVFWQDGTREAGTDYNAITQYLWQRTRWLDVQADMVAAVKDAARGNPAVTLFGDSTIAPLIALEAGVRITGDLVDTNVQRLRSGELGINEVIALLDVHPNALVLCADRGGIGTAAELRAHLAQHFQAVRVFQSALGQSYSLYRRNQS